MGNTDQVYIKLQCHLNKQPVGLPATRSGSEIEILKHIFTPAEAEIATCLTHKLEPAQQIFERAGHLIDSPEELTEVLDRMAGKRGDCTKN